LVNKANRILAGHGRLEAAKRLKLTEAPVIRLEHLSEQQAKAFMVADNRLTDRSSWDDRKLAIVLKELTDITLDFEIEATGFEAPEIDLRIQSLEPPDDSTDSADEYEVTQGPPVSRPDDLWTLGGHRLLCGNALDPRAYDVLLAGEKAAAVFTDPPDNVGMKGDVSGKCGEEQRELPMAVGELTEDPSRRHLVGAFDLMVSHSVEGATLFACIDWRHLLEIASAIQALGCEIFDLCVWVKTSGGMGSLYRSRHELVFVFGKRDTTRADNVELDKHRPNRTNVWNYPGRRRRTRGLDLHPTVKPIAMVSDAILDVTQRGDVVLDPFCDRARSQTHRYGH
jgi:DNA modification methylase